jgi:GTP-binding protein HflX
VVDISHANYQEQIQVVEDTLNDLGVRETPSLLLFNKTDAFTFVPREEDDLTPATRENLSLEEIKKQWNETRPGSVFISALRKTNIDELKDRLYQMVKEIHVKRYPYNDLLY